MFVIQNYIYLFNILNTINEINKDLQSAEVYT